jgi:transporter family-2 protein
MLKNELFIGLLVAVVAGAMIAVQSTFISRSGATIGATRSGMLTTVTGSLFAIGVLALLWRRGGLVWSWDAGTWWALVIAGILGALILTGISFASQRVGITATLATLLLGQMLVASFVDSRGLGGNPEAIPFTLARFAGIVLLAAGVYMVSLQR